MNWFLAALSKYAEFQGRARRKEYWYFALFTCIIGVALLLAGVALASLMGRGRSGDEILAGPVSIPFFLFCLAILIPALAVTVRRLHDTGRSGGWYFIGFVPFVGHILLFIFTLLDSTPGQNEYGPNPKGVPGYGPPVPLYPPPQYPAI